MSAASSARDTQRRHRMPVFTTPTCRGAAGPRVPARAARAVPREVDVSRDAAAVRDLVRRNGQMGVPVIEIDGWPVVGFDRPQIDRLVGLRG